MEVGVVNVMDVMCVVNVMEKVGVVNVMEMYMGLPVQVM